MSGPLRLRRRGGARGVADDESDGDVGCVPGGAFEGGEEGGHALFADAFGGEVDGGEFGFDGGGEGEVVEAGDGEVLGDAQAEAAGGLAGAGGEDVVVADDGGGSVLGVARAVSMAVRAPSTVRGARTVRSSVPGPRRALRASARVSKVQESMAEARWRKRRWPRGRRCSVIWRMPSAMARLTWAAAVPAVGSLSSMTRGGWRRRWRRGRRRPWRRR